MMSGNNFRHFSTDFDELIQNLREKHFVGGIGRYAYTDYDINQSLQVVEAIGKARTPNFVIDDDNRFTYVNFIKWLHADQTMQALHPISRVTISGNLKRGIYIAGNTGSGKSWCLDIMREYARLMSFKIRFEQEPSTDFTLCWLNHRADDICRVFTQEGDIHELKRRQILGIQDLGAEPKESLYMGNRLNVLRQLIEYRGDQYGQLTLITSNLKLSGKDLGDKYEDRVQSRLFEMCNYFEIKGKDRRIPLSTTE